MNYLIYSLVGIWSDNNNEGNANHQEIEKCEMILIDHFAYL